MGHCEHHTVEGLAPGALKMRLTTCVCGCGAQLHGKGVTICMYTRRLISAAHKNSLQGISTARPLR
jgi:hypothetical protein